MLRWVLSLLCAGFLTASCFAQDCSTVDLRAKMPPVRDQKKHGWCYAITTAGLVSYRLGFEVSAPDIANATERSKDPDWWAVHFGHDTARRRDTQDGASIPTALAAASVRGFCRETDLPFQKAESDLANCVGDEPPMIDQMIDSSCKKRIKPNPALKLTPLGFDPMSDSKTKRAEIDAILDSKNPVGIAHEYKVLTDARVGETMAFDRFGLQDGHDSIIVGRRWDEAKKQCEYLVRDSYGTSCAKYYDPKMCEGGNIYVPVDRLMNAVQSAYYIK